MGYVSAYGGCHTCGRLFSFNPVRVPSVRDRNGVRQPVCRDCIEQANVVRKEKGLPPFTYSDDAYEAADEHELSY